MTPGVPVYELASAAAETAEADKAARPLGLGSGDLRGSRRCFNLIARGRIPLENPFLDRGLNRCLNGGLIRRFHRAVTVGAAVPAAASPSTFSYRKRQHDSDKDRILHQSYSFKKVLELPFKPTHTQKGVDG